VSRPSVALSTELDVRIDQRPVTATGRFFFVRHIFGGDDADLVCNPGRAQAPPCRFFRGTSETWLSLADRNAPFRRSRERTPSKPSFSTVAAQKPRSSGQNPN